MQQHAAKMQWQTLKARRMVESVQFHDTGAGRGSVPQMERVAKERPAARAAR